MATVFELKEFLEKLIDDGYGDFDIRVREEGYGLSVPVKTEIFECYEDKWGMGKSHVTLK